MRGRLAWGYYPTSKRWLPILVDANGRIKADMSAINLNDLADVDVSGVADEDIFYYDSGTGLWKPKKLTGANLSQTFGASAVRLRNIIMTPVGGAMMSIGNCEGGCFTALIDDTPAAHGGQGLDATHVPYDNDTNEGLFHTFYPYDGSTVWGQLILHNLTRGNTRKIVSVDRTNNVITTSSSTDDWADNDSIDCESQTVDGSAIGLHFIDLLLSDNVGTTVDAIIMFYAFRNNVAAASAFNALYFHPYETYDTAKRQFAVCTLASENSTGILIVPVISQRITFYVHPGGTDDFNVILYLKGAIEFADT